MDGFAVFPLAFAAQQAFEGLVWLGLDHGIVGGKLSMPVLSLCCCRGQKLLKLDRAIPASAAVTPTSA